MKVTAQNYEEYALDYIEGTLSVADRAAFGRFLDDHPDIAAQVRALDGGMPVFTPDRSVRFVDKKALKRKSVFVPWMVRVGAAAAVLVGGLWVLGRFEPRERTVPLPAEQPTLTAENEPAKWPDTISEKAVEAAVEPIAVEPVATVSKTVETPAAASAAARKPESRQSTVNVRRSGEMLATEPARLPLEPLELALAMTPLREPLPDDAPTLRSEPLSAVTQGRVVAMTEEYVVESAENPFRARRTRDYFPEGENQASLLPVFNRQGLRRLAAGFLTPLSTLSPFKVYETNDERVVEVASITVSRRANQTEE